MTNDRNHARSSTNPITAFAWAWAVRLTFVGTGFLSGCADAGDQRFPVDLSGLRYQFFQADAGIFPSDAILRDPNNPFEQFPIDEALAFDVVGVGSNTATYYAWGTLLALEISDLGVAQYFTAEGLRGIFEADEFSEDTEPDSVREQAIAAYQRQLDNFPGARLDTTGAGSTFTRLATLSYLSIEALGGVVQGNWELIDTVDDNGDPIQIAVQGGEDVIVPPPIAPAEEED
ncbi:MAG: hypothetical protein AAF735_00350 [Myxococcota bacterium]